MSVLPPFGLARPENLADAMDGLSSDHMPIAGGTELLLAMRMRMLRPKSLVDVKRIPELHGIRVEDRDIVIGAAATHHQTSHNPLVREHLPILSHVLDQVGNPRIRACGTLAGNLIFAEPKSDVITILTALDASVTLSSSRGSRTLNIDDLLLGPYYTAREPNELLTEIRIPFGDVVRAEYLKYQTQERPTVGVAVLDFRDGHRRIAIGAVAELTHMVDVSHTEAINGHATAEGIDIIPDASGSVRYKRHITGVIINRTIAALNDSAAA